MRIFDKPKTLITEYLEACIQKKEDDWGLIFSICDEVNASENGAKEAAKFIRKKIGKIQLPNVQDRVLTVFKLMSENCGAKFHAEIATRKFLEEIELVARSPHTDPTIRQRIIEILRDLSNMFRNEPSLWSITNLYQKLVDPQAQNSRPPNNNNNSIQPVFIKTSDGQILFEPTEVPNPGPTPINNVLDDIELAKNNIYLFTQTISFTDPESEDITKNELIQEFYSKCKTLNQNIIKYITETQDEQWLNTLISVNQDFVNAFKLYDDMVERGQVKIAKQFSKNAIIRNNYDSIDSESFAAGVGGSGTSPSSSLATLDPFADSNEVKEEPVQRKSAKSRGKMPLSLYHDDALFEENEEDDFSNQPQSQHVDLTTTTSSPLSQPPPSPPPPPQNNNGNNMNGRKEFLVL